MRSNALYCYLGLVLSIHNASVRRRTNSPRHVGTVSIPGAFPPSYCQSLHIRDSLGLNSPSEKLLIASFDGESAKNLSVTFGSPSRIMRCTMMSDLNTIVHVESRSLFCKARNISATPASPACVATRICSTYLDLGAASCYHKISVYRSKSSPSVHTFIFVPPLTDFSKEPVMAAVEVGIYCSVVFAPASHRAQFRFFLSSDRMAIVFNHSCLPPKPSNSTPLQMLYQNHREDICAYQGST